MAENENDHAGVRVPPPVVAVGAILTGLALNWLWPAPLSEVGMPLPASLTIIAGVLLFLAGMGLAIACLFRFKAAGTAVEPWKPTTALIAHGPYRLSRNPIYLGMLLALAGVGLMLDNLWILALLLPVWAFLRFAVIAREERYLEAKFGESYRRYRVDVRRWL